MKKSFIFGLTTGLIVASTSLVLANTYIQVILNDQIKVTLNGDVQTFRDETTNEIQYPITYKDRTYLPLRTLANLVDVGIDYDSENNIAKITTKDNVDDKFAEEIEIDFEKEKWVLTNVSGDIITNTREIPTVKYSNQEVANKINKAVQAINDKYWDNAVESAYMYINDTYGYDDLGLNLNYSEYQIVDNVFRIQLFQTGTFGGVSWNDNYFSQFNLGTGEKLSIDDIVYDKSGYIDKVVEEFKKEVDRVYTKYVTEENPNYETANPDAKTEKLSYAEYFYGLNDNWEEEFRALIVEDGNWTINESGIEFCLPKYGIGVGALGTPAFEVPYEVIEEFLINKK